MLMQIILHMTEHMLVSFIALCKKIKFRPLHIDFPFRNIFEKYLSEWRQCIKNLQIFLNTDQIISADGQIVKLLRQRSCLFF